MRNQFVPGVEICESRIALDGDSGVGVPSGVATGPLPEVVGSPIGGILEEGTGVEQAPRYDNLDPNLLPPLPDPSVGFADYPSKQMLFGLAPQPTFTPETYNADDSLVPYFPNGTDAFAPDPAWAQDA